MTASNSDQLKARLGADRIHLGEVLAPYTTFRIGGPADVFFEARSADELATALRVARELGIPHFVLGLGANILVGDMGFRGLVIRNAARSRSITADGILEVESGAVVWPDLIRFVVDAGWSGLEHYAGIPSTVGGALWQNLHFLSPAPERERTMYIDEVFLDARLLHPDGTASVKGKDYFDFGYDQSVLHHSGDVVLSARFALEGGSPETMNRIIEENLAWRAERHPPLDTEPSAGSIFKKIEGIGAGRLIDQCGLKGTRIGGIEITRRHANIMINRGGGTAADVRAMIDRVVETVRAETGYVLEPEIAFVGEF
ncbi:MAG: UDP-N-acetylmuramate dehydrogenase [Bacteroidetes bacterium]|nr:UDP-N-acetylmuramate dehydrogenase [Bacteroidota bacterium]MDA0874794.1 UDP-N-acetylmuramate dehydrogenase [Bacteroidota bacterium]